MLGDVGLQDFPCCDATPVVGFQIRCKPVLSLSSLYREGGPIKIIIWVIKFLIESLLF